MVHVKVKNRIKKQNGFTLLELMGVIVLLSVISMVTVPLVVSVVTDSRKATLKNSYQNLLKAIDMNKSYDTIDFTQEYTVTDGVLSPDVDFEGELEGNGKIKINKEGKVQVKVETEEWCIWKSYRADKVEALDGKCP